jgi:hypothetical protein
MLLLVANLTSQQLAVHFKPQLPPEQMREQAADGLLLATADLLLDPPAIAHVARRAAPLIALR